jgi:hypothetical protein
MMSDELGFKNPQGSQAEAKQGCQHQLLGHDDMHQNDPLD